MSDDRRQRLGHSEARDRILAAAARVYNRHGEGATVQQIAEESDYSTAALYKHFSDKDDIFESLWLSVKEAVLEVLKTEPPMELGFVGRLKWLLFKFADMAEEQEEIFLASMATAPAPGRREDVDPSMVEFYEEYRETIQAIMQQGIDEGVLDEARDADLYTLAFGGQIQALIERWAVEGPFPLRPPMNEMLELFLRGAADPEAGLDSMDL